MGVTLLDNLRMAAEARRAEDAKIRAKMDAMGEPGDRGSTETVDRNGLPKRSTEKVDRNGLPKHSPTKAADTDQNAENDTPLLLSEKALLKTDRQRRLFKFLQANPDLTTTYQSLSDTLGQKRNTVRDNLCLFARQGLIEKKVVRIPGLGVALHIRLRSTETIYRNGLPKEKIEREKEKHLSISSPEVLCLTWPHLAQAGFGAEQLDQIVANLSALGKGTHRLVESLDHAEWELSREAMLDKDGQPVADPCSWVFQVLARTGYYRRPEGYVSSEEQATKDAEVEACAVTAAQQKADQARFEAWRGGLTSAQHAAVLQGFRGGSKDAWYKNFWIRSEKTGNES